MSDWNSSYKLGIDIRYSLEETYFFTFYSEFGERGTASRWLEAGLLGAVLLSSVVTNSLLAVGLLKARQRSVTNSFLGSLWLADSLFALGFPAVLSARLDPRWALGDIVCRLLPYSQLVCGFAMLWSLTFISVERYRCLTLDPRLQLTVSSCRLVMGGMWTLALLLFSPVLLWFHEEETLAICTLVFPRAPPPLKISLIFTVLVTLFTCLLPMAILVFNYHRIFMKMVSGRDRWSRPCVQTTSSLTRQEERRMKKHVRIMRTALLNVTVVLLMWLPVAGVLVLIYLDGDRSLADTGFFLRSRHFVWALGLALLNTAVNPLLCGALRVECCGATAPGDCRPSISRLLRIGSSCN